jgi:hypothetical protein
LSSNSLQSCTCSEPVPLRPDPTHWHAEAGVFFESTKRNFILKSNGQKAWIVLYIEGSIPPIRLGVLLGECVFNIRSALDNLVCGLIRTADSHAPCNSPEMRRRIGKNSSHCGRHSIMRRTVSSALQSDGFAVCGEAKDGQSSV